MGIEHPQNYNKYLDDCAAIVELPPFTCRQSCAAIVKIEASAQAGWGGFL
jgi:hypothetical protein